MNAEPAALSAPSTGYPAKRKRTRRRLLRAGLDALASDGPAGLSAGSIAARAGVAPGTFYNHFPSVDDFVDAIAHDVGRGIEIGHAILADIENDPATRVAIGMLQLLQMAEGDSASASAFVSLVATRPDFRARVRTLISNAITDGVDADQFDVEPGSAATDAVLGAALQSMRSVILAEAAYAEAAGVADLVLRLLGVGPRSIPAIIDRAAGVTLEAVAP